MKSSRVFMIVTAAAALLSVGAAAQSFFNTPNYMEPGGAAWDVGGTLKILSGGTLEFGTHNVAQSGAVIQGESALGGSNPTAVATGLTTIKGCSVVLKTSSAPGVGTSTLSYTTSAGTLNVYGWKPTSSSNPTLIASTGTDVFGWSCTGT